MMIQNLTSYEKQKRIELLLLKDKYNLTVRGIYLTLPEKCGSEKTIQRWCSGKSSVPDIILIVLRHLLEGVPISSKYKDIFKEN